MSVRYDYDMKNSVVRELEALIERVKSFRSGTMLLAPQIQRNLEEAMLIYLADADNKLIEAGFEPDEIMHVNTLYSVVDWAANVHYRHDFDWLQIIQDRFTSVSRYRD